MASNYEQALLDYNNTLLAKIKARTPGTPFTSTDGKKEVSLDEFRNIENVSTPIDSGKPDVLNEISPNKTLLNTRDATDLDKKTYSLDSTKTNKSTSPNIESEFKNTNKNESLNSDGIKYDSSVNVEGLETTNVIRGGVDDLQKDDTISDFIEIAKQTAGGGLKGGIGTPVIDSNLDNTIRNGAELSDDSISLDPSKTNKSNSPNIESEFKTTIKSGNVVPDNVVDKNINRGSNSTDVLIETKELGKKESAPNTSDSISQFKSDNNVSQATIRGGTEELLDFNTRLYFSRLIPLSVAGITSAVSGAANDLAAIQQGGAVALAAATKAAGNIFNGTVDAVNKLKYLTNEEILRLALLSPATMDQRGISVKLRTRENITTNPQEFEGNIDLDFGEKKENYGKKKRMLEKTKGDANLLGGLVIRPIDSAISNTKTIFLPFQFNPDISEGSIAAQYESIQILGRVGNLYSYLRTDLPELTINLKYMVTAKDSADKYSGNDYGKSWMKQYTPSYLKKIETMFRSIALPQFTNGGNGEVYLAPPYINVIFGQFGKELYDANPANGIDGFSQSKSVEGSANLSFYKPNNGGKGFSLKKFICTSVNIKKDYNTNPIIHQKNEWTKERLNDESLQSDNGNYDSIMFDVSISLQEVTPSYENYYYDFYDYYKSYTNDYLLAATTQATTIDNSFDAFSALGSQGTGEGIKENYNQKYQSWKSKIDTTNQQNQQNAAEVLQRQLYGDIQAFIFKNEGLK